MINRLYSIIVVVILFFLSVLGAFCLFKILDSEAHLSGTGWSIGGACAGFVIIYKLLDKTFHKIYRPVLPGDQTLALIHLFTDSVKGQLVRRVFEWIDALDNKEQLSSLEDRREVMDGIRHKSRQFVTCFATPFGNLNKHLEAKWNLDFTQKDVQRVMELLESDLPNWEKRKRIWEIADKNQDKSMIIYIDELRELKVL